MADTKALFTQRFEAARTALTAGNEAAAAESLHAAIVAARSDPSLRRELASALFHLGKLSRKFGRAGDAEAEVLLTEALAISEELFGREHAALAPLLNELGRLHIHRSQHARAEDVLKRLLAIARGKSEESADVATVLAGLAVVKRKLGDDASAEALFRDALRIREKTLEPNHMVTVVTLEHLSETCAARGNFVEALALLRRALATREVSLGPGHATVQAAQSRVTELELQVAVAADTAAKAARGSVATPAWLKRVPDSRADTPSTTVPSPINSKKLEFLGESEPLLLRPAPAPAPAPAPVHAPPPAPRSREFAKTPAVAAAVAAASLMASSMQKTSGSHIVVSPAESVRPSGSITDRESRGLLRDVVFANVVQGDVAIVDATPADAVVSDWRSTVALVLAKSPKPALTKRTVLYASAGVPAVAIALAGLLMLRPGSGSGKEPVSTELSAPQRTAAAGAPVVTAPAKRAVSIGTVAAAVVAETHTDSLRVASATPAPTAAVIQQEQRAPDSAPPGLRAPRVQVHVNSVNIPSVPAPLSVDAILHSATERQRASDTDRAETTPVVPHPAPADLSKAHSSPRIIGRMPEPTFPPELLRSGTREGQVVVRFLVNELGKVDVASIIVEQSDDELFTAAVRDVLPSFRFDPARTLGLESRPVAAWVSLPFRFTTNKKK
jgi:TonB family protein